MAKKDVEHAQEPEQTTNEAAVAVEEQPAQETLEASNSETEIVKLQQENDALKDQILRAAADFQNFRRRVEQDKRQLRQFATENLVAELLPVLDNFERTLAAVESGATIESLVEGVKAVDRQLRSVLETQDVRRIAAQGAPFDPDQHEAIATEEHPELPDGTITAELQAGYKMADKIIRPARVKVAKGA